MTSSLIARHAAPRHWAGLLLLVVLWGSSYSLIEVALSVVAPLQLTALRITAAALVLLVGVVASGRRLPPSPGLWGRMLLMALLGSMGPFFLISWGQLEVESALAGILAAITPLCVLVMAHFLLPDERLERRHALAFLLAFAGVVVLLGGEALGGLGGSVPRLLAQLALLLAAICYAGATVYARFLPGTDPLVTAAMVMSSAALLLAPVTLGSLPALAGAGALPLLALGFLGVFGTGLASIVYFQLIRSVGARFTSLLNYLVPVWAALLGAQLLGERVPTSAWLALALILAGMLLTQRKRDG